MSSAGAAYGTNPEKARASDMTLQEKAAKKQR
jgi:hypothetical protein